MLRSAHDKCRARGQADHLVCDAAEEEAGEPTMAAAADDDEIGPPIPGCCDDLVGGVTERRLGRDPARTLCLSRSPRMIEHGLGRREAEFGRRILDVLYPRIFLEGRIDSRGETRDDRQQN